MDEREKMWANSTYGKNPAHYHFAVIAEYEEKLTACHATIRSLEQTIREFYQNEYGHGMSDENYHRIVGPVDRAY